MLNAAKIRDRCHPLFYLRKSSLFRIATSKVKIATPVRLDGLPFPIYVDLLRDLSWVLGRGRFGAETDSEIANYLQLITALKAQTLWDIGANVGLYSWKFLLAAEQPNAILFEPDKRNIELLERTIERNGLKVVLVRKAVSDREGTTNFYPDTLTGATGSVVFGDDEQLFVTRHHNVIPEPVVVETTTIDAMVNRVPRPDIIKIDVEGAEKEVIEGGLDTIAKFKPALIVECSRQREWLTETFLRLGYLLHDLRDLAETASVAHNCLALHQVRHASILGNPTFRVGPGAGGH